MLKRSILFFPNNSGLCDGAFERSFTDKHINMPFLGVVVLKRPTKRPQSLKTMPLHETDFRHRQDKNGSISSFPVYSELCDSALERSCIDKHINMSFIGCCCALKSHKTPAKSQNDASL